MMADVPKTSKWGSFALVSYLPDPLGSFLNQLRHSLTGENTPHAHVTILPRRPLATTVEGASQHLLQVLTGFSSFPVELSSIRRFPQTNVFYIDVSEGSARLHALHDALGVGELAYDEEFEFRPHLTLGHPLDHQLGRPVSSSDVEALCKLLETAWDASPISRRYVLEELVCLWLPPNGLVTEWRPLWSYNLKTGHTVSSVPERLCCYVSNILS